jgi:uncharacterized protein YbjT (DUF2867 family)
MRSKKLIAVLGATGQQGGAVVQAFLEDPAHEFAIRAITRHGDCDKAQALKRAGVDVVYADLDDKASLAQAFRGAHGAFIVTNYAEHCNSEKELQQAQNAAEATKKANVKHVVWSSLEDTRKIIPETDHVIPWIGKCRVPSFDAKGEANGYFRTSGVPYTIIDTSFYWDNLLRGMCIRVQEDESVVLTIPMGKKKLPGIAVKDIGRCVREIFKNPECYTGKEIALSSDHLTGYEMATTLSNILGKQVTYDPMTCDEFAQQLFVGAADLANTFRFFQEYNNEYIARRDVVATRKLHPRLLSFEDFVTENKMQLLNICCPAVRG